VHVLAVLRPLPKRRTGVAVAAGAGAATPTPESLDADLPDRVPATAGSVGHVA
jgi:hypothetical protein